MSTPPFTAPPSIATSQRPRAGHSLNGYVAIVTGAGSKGDGIGNGRAASLLLAADGAAVVCVDLTYELAESTAAMIRAEGGKAIAVAADVSNEKQCEAIMEQAMGEFNRLDILVNNVGIDGPPGKSTEVSFEKWAKAMDINVASMAMMAKYAIPAMLKNDTAERSWRGSIVNLGSIAGMQGGSPNLMYAASKGAVINLTKAMASHHGADGIRVNCICPGMVFTPMVYGTGMTEEMRNTRKSNNLLQVEGNGWDIGSAVRFLASDDARWITGVILPVDAGTTAAKEIVVSQWAY